MCSSLVPVLANITMNKLEGVIIKLIIADCTVKFYSRFVDGTLLVVNPENASHVYKVLNKSD